MAAITCLTMLPAPVSAQITKPDNASMRFDDSLVDAADKGNIRAVMGLVQSGKFVDSKGRFDATPLMRATFNQHTEVVKYLLSKGANPNIKDIGGATALHIAARRKSPEAMELLLQSGAEPNSQDKEGWTPLMRAAIEGNAAAVKLLLSHNASPNVANIMRETPLMHAVFAGDAESTKLLVKYGADVRHKDENGLTAADIAYQRGADAVLEVLAAPPVAADPLERPTIRSNLPASPSKPATVKAPRPLSQQTPVAAQRMETIAPAEGMATPDAEKLKTLDLPPELAQDQEKAAAQETDTPTQPKRGFGFSPLPTLEDADVFDEEQEPGQQGHAAPIIHSPDDIRSARPTGGTHYLLQLGTFPTQQEAREHWNALTSTQPDLLGSAEMVISEAALRTNSRTVYRTQAGYFTSRRVADQLCGALFERKIDCFVVESTGGDTGDKDMASLSSPPPETLLPSAPSEEMEEAAPALPLSAPPESLSTPPGFSSLRDDSSPEAPDEEEIAEEDTEQDNAPWRILKEKQEHDSRAIPSPLPTLEEEQASRSEPPASLETPPAPKATRAVPVTPAVAADLASLPTRSSFSSDSPPPATPQETATPAASDKPVELTSLPPVAPEAPAAQAEPLLPSKDDARSHSWLQLSSFPGEQQAREFWDGLLVTQPALSNGLRFRVTQPMQMRGIGPVAVRVGPLASQEQLEGLCAFAKERKITCRTVNDIGASSTAYMARYRGDDAAAQPAPATASPIRMIASSPMAPGGTPFWVMLGSYPDRMQAEREWKLLRDIHADVLPNYTPDISTPRYSSSSSAVLRLRVGPFAEQRQALQLCSTLQRRGTRCLTLRD